MRDQIRQRGSTIETRASPREVTSLLTTLSFSIACVLWVWNFWNSKMFQKLQKNSKTVKVKARNFNKTWWNYHLILSNIMKFDDKFERFFELNLLVSSEFCTILSRSWKNSFALHEYHSYLVIDRTALTLLLWVFVQWKYFCFWRWWLDK